MKAQEITVKVSFDYSRVKKVLSMVEEIIRLQQRLKARSKKGYDLVGSVCNDIAEDLVNIINNFDYEQMQKELQEVLDRVKELDNCENQPE